MQGHPPRIPLIIIAPDVVQRYLGRRRKERKREGKRGKEFALSGVTMGARVLSWMFILKGICLVMLSSVLTLSPEPDSSALALSPAPAVKPETETSLPNLSSEVSACLKTLGCFPSS